MERLQAGAVKPRLVEVREGELLGQATEAARLAAERKGLAFALCCVPERTVVLDPDLTRSTIQNLVDNAVKYTDAGRIEVVTEDLESSWSVHVHDNCHGLSGEELRTIFEPFRRGATSKRGAGLGLAIARRAIESQGGTIHAESPGAVGCHFWFRLPKR
jgi:signal transduction histidine kinase